MKITEIIHVRLPAGMPPGLCEKIRKSISAEIPAEFFTILERENLGSDLAVHIHRNDDNTQSVPRQFGIHLVSSLKEYGLVDHTIWKELGSN